jgi:hypothetical protein
LVEIFITGYQDRSMGANTTNYMFQTGSRDMAKMRRKFEFSPPFFSMARKRRSRLATAARARAVRHIQAISAPNDPEDKIITPTPPTVLEIISDEECHWTGGVNHTLSSDSEFYWTDGESKGSTSDSQEFSEMEDEDFLQSLKENLAEELETIRKWEHWMIRWMEAYRGGLGAKDAQLKVKEFSSRLYTSHQRLPETLAHRV